MNFKVAAMSQQSISSHITWEGKSIRPSCFGRHVSLSAQFLLRVSCWTDNIEKDNQVSYKHLICFLNRFSLKKKLPEKNPG